MQKKVSADTSALETILERLWDPIGVYQDSSGAPCPPGEYDTYTGWIIGHLYEGGDRSSVLADMVRARENMGLASSSRDDEAADAILDWWQSRATS
jgi:hypothetical protein